VPPLHTDPGLVQYLKAPCKRRFVKLQWTDPSGDIHVYTLVEPVEQNPVVQYQTLCFLWHQELTTTPCLQVTAPDAGAKLALVDSGASVSLISQRWFDPNEETLEK